MGKDTAPGLLLRWAGEFDPALDQSHVRGEDVGDAKGDTDKTADQHPSFVIRGIDARGRAAPRR